MTDQTPTADDLAPGLLPTATVSERISAFQHTGLTTSDLATCTGVTEAAIRNWSESAHAPREPAARALDDLRTALLGLSEASIVGERAAAWLTSRNTGRWLQGQRPIEVLLRDPLRVFAAIEELIGRSQEDDQSEQEDEQSAVHLQLVVGGDASESQAKDGTAKASSKKGTANGTRSDRRRVRAAVRP